MLKLLKNNKNTIAGVFLVLLIAFFVRAYNLTILPVFADEAIYIRWAQVMRAEPTLRFLPLSDGKQPLFMWSIIPFFKIFSDPLLAGRLVSVLCGMSTMVGVGTLTYLLFKSKKAALVSALIYALSPYAVFFDRMALADSMLAMFTIWTVNFAYLAHRYLRLDMAMLAGFALGGAALTKSPSLFVTLLLPSILLLINWPKKKAEKAIHLIKATALLLVTGVIAAGMYNILRLGPNFHMLSSRNLDYVYPVSHILERPLDPFLPHFDRAMEWIRLLGPEILIFFVFFALIKNFSKYWKEILFLAIWVLVPIAIQSMYAKVFTARYIYFTIPFLFVLSGSCFTKPLSTLSKKVLYLVLGLFVVHALYLNSKLVTHPEAARLPSGERSGYLEEWTAGTGIKEVADYIKAEHAKDPERGIVVGTEGYFGTLPDGLQIYLEGVPNVTVIGVGLGINQVPQPLRESATAGNKTYLLANTSRLNFDVDYQEHGLELIANYKKAEKADKTFEELYLFKVN